jgi:DnaJ-class molecular chaperone
MKRKCDHCRGRGGWLKPVGAFRTLYVSCVHCKGKGSWWPAKRPKQKKG